MLPGAEEEEELRLLRLAGEGSDAAAAPPLALSNASRPANAPARTLSRDFGMHVMLECLRLLQACWTHPLTSWS
jgi:hypothetical protein